MTKMRRTVIIIGPLLLNWIVVGLFLAIRPPSISFLEQRERMRRDPGVFFVSSGDPHMFVAERPLYRWNKWHGGEALWVKVVEILNFPALVAAKRGGDIWVAYAAPRGIGSFRGDTWVRAWIYALVLSIQWLVVGFVIATFVRRRQRVTGDR